MERVWDIGKKVALGSAVLVAIPVAIPVIVPCVFVLSIAAAALSVPIASTAVGYYALKKVVGFGKTRVLGWRSDSDREEHQQQQQIDAGWRDKIEDSSPPPSSAAYVPSEGECEIVPVSQEPIVYHQHEGGGYNHQEGYNDQDIVEGSARLGVCATLPPDAATTAVQTGGAEEERIGAEGGPEVCEQETAAKMVQLNVAEQPRVDAFVGSQNVEGGEYQLDELVAKEETGKEVPSLDGALELQEEQKKEVPLSEAGAWQQEEQKEEVPSSEAAAGQQEEQKGEVPFSETGTWQQEEQKEEVPFSEAGTWQQEEQKKEVPSSEAAAGHQEEVPSLEGAVEQQEEQKEGLPSSEAAVGQQEEQKEGVPSSEAAVVEQQEVANEEVESKPVLGQQEAGKEEQKEMPSLEATLEQQASANKQEEQKPMDEEVTDAEADKMKQTDQQAETLSFGQENEGEGKVGEDDKGEPEGVEPIHEPHDAGKKRLASQVEQRLPEPLAPEAQEKAVLESGGEHAEAEEKEVVPETAAVPEYAEEKPLLQPEAEEKAGAEPEAEEEAVPEGVPETALPEPAEEQWKPLLHPEAEDKAVVEPEAADEVPDDQKGHEDNTLGQRAKPEVAHNLEPKLETTGVHEQEPVDVYPDSGGDVQQSMEHEGDTHHEQLSAVVEPKEDLQQEPAVDDSSEQKPVNLSEEESTGYHRLDAASSMDEYVSVPEEFPEDGISTSDSRRFHSQELPRTSSGRSEDPLMREILTVQKVVGYKDDLRESPADEVERLYDFLGVEIPEGYENTTDPRKLLESLDLLKAIVGVK